MDDDTIALHKRRGGCGELSETVDLQRNVLIVIAQRDVGTALTSGIDLRDLPGTQTDGHRSTAIWNFSLSRLTGQGLSAVVSPASRGSGLLFGCAAGGV